MELGKFIALEGGEGAGKSTQARLLQAELMARGIACIHTREPGGTPGAEAIRDLLLHPPGQGWGAQAEAMLFAAARADHVARLIRPALEAGTWVICDRFLDSSRAYQGVAGALGDGEVRALHAIGSGGLLPDLTLVLAARTSDVATRLRMRDGEKSDAIGSRDAGYHACVNDAFRHFATLEPGRFALIEGSGSIEDVQARILAAIAEL